ncbi:MAG: hypothetical protein AB8G77_28285 [Rhodothermales bacterium]
MHKGNITAENPENGSGGQLSRFRIVAWTLGGLMLFVPLIAMQFTDEVNWDAADFVIFGVLIAGAGLVFELASGKTGNVAYKAGAGLALAAAFLMIWINGAVGIIGNESNDANLMYFGVLGVGVIGVLISRFKPKGMAYALVATGVAQGLVFLIAWVAGWGFTGPITLFFLAFWLGAARLFQKAAHEESASRSV